MVYHKLDEVTDTESHGTNLAHIPMYNKWTYVCGYEFTYLCPISKVRFS